MDERLGLEFAFLPLDDEGNPWLDHRVKKCTVLMGDSGGFTLEATFDVTDTCDPPKTMLIFVNGKFQNARPVDARGMLCLKGNTLTLSQQLTVS